MVDVATLHTWAAVERYRREGAGVQVGGVFVPTDDRTRGILTAAYVAATQDQNYSIPNWKVADGQYVTLDASTIIAIANAVRDHVQACFDKNKDVDALIDSGAVTTRGQIVAAFEDN